MARLQNVGDSPARIWYKFAMSLTTVPIDTKDPLNARILAVSEDRIQGFLRDPLGEIARLAGVELPVVVERIQAMLRAGTIRRVRQTLLATNLAQGSLVAWEVPQEKLDAAFDYMFQQDPFSGHVVTRSTVAATPGSRPRRRTCPTPSANKRLAGINRKWPAPVCCARNSQCLVSE